MNKQQILKYLIENDGLPIGKTWGDVAEFFNILPPDPVRAEKDEDYKKKSPGRVVNDIWRTYQRRKLRLKKQTFVDGKLKYETFKVEDEKVELPDLEDFEVTQVTTTPYGNPYIKFKKKVIGDKNHLETLTGILIEKIVPKTLKEKKPLKTQKKAIFVYFSDRHIGALTKENSIYRNLYDEKEILKRNVDDVLQFLRDLNIEEYQDIFIMDLGDALDGFNQKTTGGLNGTSSHILPQQMNNREQFDTYVKAVKVFFDNLYELIHKNQNIYFIATGNSNHGGDFDYMAMKTAELYLNLKYPFIKTYITDRFIDHFEYGNHVIIFSHGKDSEDKKRGLPLTLDQKTENFISDYIRINKLEKKIITFVSGDLHQFATTYGKNFRYLKVLSQYGGSKWIHSNFGTSRPGITVELFDKEDERIFTTNYYYDIADEKNTGFTI